MVQPLWWSVTLFDKLILRVCQLRPVFFSDILRDVSGMTSIVQTVLYPAAKAILTRLTICVFSKAENWGRFFMSDPVYDTCCVAMMLVSVTVLSNRSWLVMVMKLHRVLIPLSLLLFVVNFPTCSSQLFGPEHRIALFRNARREAYSGQPGGWRKLDTKTSTVKQVVKTAAKQANVTATYVHQAYSKVRYIYRRNRGGGHLPPTFWMLFGSRFVIHK